MDAARPKYDLDSRLLAFSARVVRLVLAFPANLPAKRIGDQLLRCATSAGANYEEARGTFSRADFCHRLPIALKEMRETLYWLNLVRQSGLCDGEELTALINEASQLRAILGKSTVTARRIKAQTADGKP